MNEVFRCDDKETLVAYLYGDVDSEVRREVERHLRSCAACARETEGLQAVRQDLQTWLAPEPDLDFEIVPRSVRAVPRATVLRPARFAALRDLPAWARVAAAALFIGVGLAAANVQVRSTSDGLEVTTGWARPNAASVVPATAPEAAGDDFRRELAALEQTLRSELAAQRAALRVAAPEPRSEARLDPAALMRRVEELIEASENRQRQEFATRLVQANNMWNVQRTNDLVQFQRTFNGLQNRTLAVQVNQQEISNQVKHLQRVNFVQPNQ
jgi:anti-sigma factor RsiW